MKTQTQPRPTQRRTAPLLTRDQLAALDERTLVEWMLRRNEEAWEEFIRRYDRDARNLAARSLRKVMSLPSDAADDVIGDLFFKLITEDMRRLRKWLAGDHKGGLKSWLGMLIYGIAVDHMRAATRRFATSLVGDDEVGDLDNGEEEDPSMNDRRKKLNERTLYPGRGAEWIASERAACDDLVKDQPKKKRRRRVAPSA